MNYGKRWILAALLMFGCLLVISCGSSDEGVTGDGTVSGTKSECEHRLDGGALLRAATCERDGEMRYTCTLCGYTETRRIPAGHVVAVDAAVPATCLTDGKTEGSHCSVCGAVLKEQKTLPKTEHRPVAMPSVEATCASAGHTGGSHCEVCGFVFEEPQVLPKKAHTPVSDPAVPATCMTEGKTYGSHCSVCGEVLQAQLVVPKSGHTPVTDPAVAATCLVEGKTEGSHCSVCGVVLKAQQVVPKSGHRYAEGWTSDGTHHWHASACGHESEISGRAEHTFSGWIIDRAATEETAGEKHRVCAVCYRTETVEIPKLAHTHKYAEGWTSDETHHWHASACGHESEISGRAEHTYRGGFCSVCGAKDPRIVVKVYIDGYLDQTLYTSEKQGYRITPPEKPDDIMTNPSSKEYFYAWFVDANFQTPLFDSTEFHADGAIYGKWIKVYFDDFTYTVNEGKATITEFTNTYRKATVVIVPAYINGFPVTAIGAGAFKGDKMIRTVILCDGIREIGSSAFAGCNSMTRIDLPESLVAIGSSAFNNCTTLPEVRLPENLESIGEYAFTGCRSLTEIAIPGSVKSIGRYAFWLCTGLMRVTMPEGVESLSDYVFSGCESLTEIAIPGSVKSIGVYAFRNCTALTDIVIPESVEWIDKGAFCGCTGLTRMTLPFIGRSRDEALPSAKEKYTFLGWIFDASGYDDNHLYVPGSLKEVIVTGSAIGSNAFYHCTGLACVTLGIETSEIGSYVFDGCTGLTGFVIPNEVKNIGVGAFYNCTGLKNVTMPESVTGIGSSAFKNCTGLTEITIPAGVKTIEKEALSGCTGLTSITIPEGVLNIGESAFFGCEGMTKIIIPGSVKNIGNRAFSGCAGLESIIVSEDNATYHSSGNCLIETAYKRLILGCKNSIIPSDGSVTSIGEAAFYGCTGLLEIVIPEGITVIGPFAFFGCGGLTGVTIPVSALEIGEYAFNCCTGLTEITIPDRVASIGKRAFYGCTDLTNVTIGESVSSIGGYAFAKTGLKNAYFKVQSGWGRENAFLRIPFDKETLENAQSAAEWLRESDSYVWKRK